MSIKWKLILVSVVFWAQGTIPAFGIDPSSFSIGQKSKLDYLMIEIAGQDKPIQISDGQHLAVVRGDRFRVLTAVLRNRDIQPSFVNLVGFVPDKPNAVSIDDRGFWVNSDTDLLKSWSIKKNGKHFILKVGNNSGINGIAYIDIIEPELKYMNASINGKSRLIRAGDFLVLKSTDKFKVNNVITNIQDDKKDVEVEFAKIHENEEKESLSKFLEMRLLRNSIVFAKIAVRVDD